MPLDDFYLYRVGLTHASAHCDHTKRLASERNYHSQKYNNYWSCIEIINLFSKGPCPKSL